MPLIRQSLKEENRVAFDFPEAYFVIDNVSINNSRVNFRVVGYANKVAKEYVSPNANQMGMPGMSNQKSIIEKNHDVLITDLPTVTGTGTPVELLTKQCEAYLKSLPEFASSTLE